MTDANDLAPRPDGDPAPRGRWSLGNGALFWLGLIIGVALLVGLSVAAGADEIANALQTGGPALLLLIGFHLFHLLPHTLAWWLLYPVPERPAWSRLLVPMWVGQSVNLLLPVANVGGELVKLRLLLRRAAPAAAIASVFADKTALAITAIVLLITGVLLMAAQAAEPGLIVASLVAAAAMAVGVTIFIRLQRSRTASHVIDRVARWRGGGRGWLHAGARDVETTLDGIYRRPVRFLWATMARAASVVLLAIEVWVAAALMGVELSLLEAVTLRLVGSAARAYAFLIWGGIGVQEGVFAAIGALYGVPAASLIAVSLATRVREVAVALPGVAYWLLTEGNRAIGAAANVATVRRGDSPYSE